MTENRGLYITCRSILFFFLLFPLILLIPPPAGANEAADRNVVADRNNEEADNYSSAPFSKRAYHSADSETPLRILPLRTNPRIVTLEEVNQREGRSGLMNTIGNTPGYAFLASALLPGLGQAANNQWWKTAFFVAVEATAIGVYIHRENRGRDGERYYQEYGDEHWSVVQYAQYVAEQHGHQHGYDFYDLLTREGRDQFDANGYIDPAFDTDQDWDVVDIHSLREAERNSRFGNNETFSHTLHSYGSQQYYELMSKYYQFGPGWRMWDGSRHSVDNGNMSDDFWYHARIGFDFNDDLNLARNMFTVIIANHFVAAFDAYFTQQFREARIKPTASMDYGLRPTFGFDYRF